MAKEAAETVVLVIDEEGIEPLISELVKGVNDSQVFSCNNRYNLMPFICLLHALPTIYSIFYDVSTGCCQKI